MTTTPLTSEQYLVRLRDMMREAVKETQRLDAKWNKTNDEVNEYLRNSGVTDVVQVAKVKGQNLALADYLSGGNWWRAKAVYLATVIQAELAMREAGI